MFGCHVQGPRSHVHLMPAGSRRSSSSSRVPDRPDHLRPARLGRPVPGPDDVGIRLGPRHLRARHRDPEPPVGRRTALRGRRRGPVRRLAGALRRRLALRGRARGHGLRDDPGMLHPRGGRADRLRLSGCSFNLVLGAFSKLLPEERRPMAFGAGTAAGSFGQFLFPPSATS